MGTYPIGIALLLAAWAYLGIVLWLGPGLWLNEALVSGFVTGIIIGNIPLGLSVGVTMTLLSLGQWTYGGASIPDYQTGSIVGTAIGALATGSLETQTTIALAVAIPTALLMTQMDILGRATNTIFMHSADSFVKRGDERGISMMHLLGQLPWGLTRAIPVFLAVWLGAGPIKTIISDSPAWLIQGIGTAGHMLPALGFALLLSMLPVKKFWPFLLIGFILFAYMKLPLLAVGLTAVAISFAINLMQAKQTANTEPKAPTDVAVTPAEPVPAPTPAYQPGGDVGHAYSARKNFVAGAHRQITTPDLPMQNVPSSIPAQNYAAGTPGQSHTLRSIRPNSPLNVPARPAYGAGGNVEQVYPVRQQNFPAAGQNYSPGAARQNIAASAPVEPVNTSKGIVELPPSILRKAMWRHLITLQWSWNYERMQALGYLYSMLPVINAVYKDKTERIAAMKRHLVFYNTNNYIGSPAIFGATVALEAQKEGEVVDGLKLGLMGPLAGIGDTITALLIKPIFSVIAASVALSAGAVAYLGPGLMILASFILMGTMFPQYWFGYRQGINVAKEFSGSDRITRITDLAVIIGLTVMGAFIPFILKGLTTPLVYQQTVTAIIGGVKQTKTFPTAVQPALDAILPYSIPIVVVALAFWLMKGLKLSPVWVLLILAALGFVCSVVGIL